MNRYEVKTLMLYLQRYEKDITESLRKRSIVSQMINEIDVEFGTILNKCSENQSPNCRDYEEFFNEICELAVTSCFKFNAIEVSLFDIKDALEKVNKTWFEDYFSKHLSSNLKSKETTND